MQQHLSRSLYDIWSKPLSGTYHYISDSRGIARKKVGVDWEIPFVAVELVKSPPTYAYVRF